MQSITNAFEYPRDHEDWMKTVLIGGLLSAFAFLLVPIFIIYGYILRVIRYRLDGDPHPPLFDEWGELLVDGIKISVIGVVYLLIPLVVGTATVGGSIAAIATGTQGGTATGVAGLFVGFMITLVLSLLFGYIAVAAILNFAHEGYLSAAFEFDTLRTIMFDSDYAVAWLLSIAIIIGAGMVAGALNIIPIVGAIIGAFIVFYAQVMAAYLWAGGYSAARNLGEQNERSGIDRSTI